MLWTPRDFALGDVTIIRVGAEYHLFSEARWLDRAAKFPGTRVVGHAVSRDLFQWEELPVALECGAEGSFDAHDIYHMDVFVHDGVWYMYYTGIDRPGRGQQQSIGLATSRDGLRWTKRGNGPVLRADPRWYEPAIPREATYQEKDFDRLWFRDPVVWRDPIDRRFRMIVVARDRHQHPDVRGCLALAVSDDLERWTPQAPLYSPGRFHTIETPSIFEHGGRYYLMFMTHSGWGSPILATDPYQTAGDFYAVSEHGWAGPYLQPADEIVVATHAELGVGPRFGAQRTVAGPDGERFLYGWLLMDARGDDLARKPVRKQMLPPPRRVRFGQDGQMRVMYHEGIENFTEPSPPFAAARAAITPLDESHWRTQDDVVGKHLGGRAVALLEGNHRDFIVSARISFHRGERAGLIVRAADGASEGWYIVADRRFGRVELGILPGERFLDARRWPARDEVVLTVVAHGPSVEVYADRQLMIHQVRYRESEGLLGYIVERGEARFDRPRLQAFRV
jgi:beta-fructofuranosidase